MKYFKVAIQLKSALVTPLLSDTIFGHVCNGIAQNEGQEGIERFLDNFEQNPFAVSNAFPKDFLPIPLLDPPKKMVNSKDEYKNIKKLKKINYLPAHYFFDAKCLFNQKKINEIIEKEDLLNGEKIPKAVSVEKLHNSIDRFTNASLEGGLYTVKELWFDKDICFDIYVTTKTDKAIVKKYFEQAFEFGYGADAAIGKGVIEILQIDEISFASTGNRLMALGHFVVGEDDVILNLKSDMFTRFGKIGGIMLNQTENPFKKPILLHRAGATFDYRAHKALVGTLIGDIHTDKRIRHGAVCPVIPITVQDET